MKTFTFIGLWLDNDQPYIAHIRAEDLLTATDIYMGGIEGPKNIVAVFDGEQFDRSHELSGKGTLLYEEDL